MTTKERLAALAESPTKPLFKSFVCEDISKVASSDDKTDTSRQRKFVVSTGSVDRDGDTIDPAGWNLGPYKANPVILFAHAYDSLPIARAVKIGIENNKLVAVAEFAKHEMAQTCLDLIDGGFLRGTSVGFRPLKFRRSETRDGIDHLSHELLEFSICPVPANADCLLQASAAGINVAPLKAWAEGILKGIAMPVKTKALGDPDTCKSCGAALGKMGALMADGVTCAVCKKPSKAVADEDVLTLDAETKADASTCTACGGPMVDGKCAACGQRAPDSPELVAGMEIHASVDVEYVRHGTVLPDGPASPFDRDAVAFKAFVKARDRAQRKAGDVPLTDLVLADFLSDYGFDAEAAELRGPVATEKVVEKAVEPPKKKDAGEEAAELVSYQTLGTMLDQVGSLLTAARGLVSGLVSDETETPTTSMSGETAEEALEEARLDSLQALCQQMLGGLNGVCQLAMDLNADDDLIAGTSGIYGMAAAASEAIEKVTKRGRVISAKNEAKIKTAHEHIGSAAGHLDDVLKSIGDAPMSEEAAVSDAHVLTLTMDDDDIEVVQIDMDDADETFDVTKQELREVLQGALKTALGGIVQQETQATLNRLRGRVE